MRLLLNVNICSKENVDRSIYYSNDRVYYVLHYNKKMICYDDYILGLYRSVVYSFLNNNILSFSPPKSLTNRVFMEKYPLINNSLIINEFIEGIMVNLYYDKEIGKWDIATRDKIGGKYYISSTATRLKKKTVYELFLEACRAEPTEELNDLVLVSLLPCEMSYTFILKRLNKTVVSPQLYLVSVFIIYKKEVEYISPIEYESWNIFSDINGVIMFPKRLENITTYNDLICKVKSINNDITDNQQGYMVSNIHTGEKTKFTNYVNEMYKKTKNVEPNLQYQYFCFSRISKECGSVWIRDIPINRKKFYLIHHEFEDFIHNVHTSYMEKYIYKTKEDILDKYEIHIDKIHRDIYLPSLKTMNKVDKVVITRDIVRNYFNDAEPRELLFIINTDRRKMVS